MIQVKLERPEPKVVVKVPVGPGVVNKLELTMAEAAIVRNLLNDILDERVSGR